MAKLHSEVIGFNSAAIAATAMDSFTVAVERTRGDNKGQVMIGFCAAEKFLRDGFNYFNSGWYLIYCISYSFYRIKTNSKFQSLFIDLRFVFTARLGI